MAMATQPATAQPTRAATAILRVARDADRVLFVRNGDLWTSALSGASPHRLTTTKFYASPTGTEDYFWNPPRVSPDARYVVAASTMYGTWLFRADGSEARRIGPEFDEVTWSPDSRAITYTIGGEATGRVYVRTLADWEHPRALGSDRYHKAGFPKWSPDGQWIAFLDFPSTSEVGAPVHFDLLRPDGTGFRMIDTIGLGGRDYSYRELQWSRDGHRIFVQSSGVWEITEQAARRVEAASGAGLLSPAGVWVSWDRIRAINAQIPPPHTPQPNDYQGCTWSFGGERLACFVPSYSDKTSVLMVTDLLKQQPARLELQLPQLQEVRWLPDDNALIVGSATLNASGDRIWRIRLDGSVAPELITAGLLMDVLIGQ
jgi:hypothetical protein